MNRDRRGTDPVVASLLVFSGLIVAGFVVMVLGWRVAAGTLILTIQVPALVSAGFGGLALIAIGTGLLSAQLSRRRAADERAEVDAVLDALSDLVRLTQNKGSA